MSGGVGVGRGASPSAGYAWHVSDDALRRLAVRDGGNADGRPMLLAHGFGCDQSMWRFITPAFDAEYRTITFDYVGAGASDRSAYDPDRYSSLEGYADDVLGIIRALDLRDVVMVAHSVSAMIAILASIAEPDRFGDLILVTPSPRYLDDLPGYRGGFGRADIEGLLQMMDVNAMGWAAYLAPVVMGNPDRPELSTDLEATFCSIDPTMARQFAKVTFLADNRADLDHVTTPSLVIQCTNDAVAPMSVGAYLADHLVGTTLSVIDATGHCPHVSHPAQTVAAIQAYLLARRAQAAVTGA
jgi:sigma-B regulation protein RsbQ